MTKEFWRECIKQEVYESYKKGKLSIVDKIWCRFFRPESNAAYLVRTFCIMQILRGEWKNYHKFYAQMMAVILMRRYSIYVFPKAEIGIGLRIVHPAGIFITNAVIGENFTIFQNCTVGVKVIGKTAKEACPHIGNGVTMYANSMVSGAVTIGDGAIIASCACVTKDAHQPGVYTGIPAKLLHASDSDIIS